VIKPQIEREEHGGATVLRMAHGKVNALDLELLTALVGALEELAASGAPPVVLTGRGSSFSAGVDLKRIVDDPPGYVEDFLRALSAAFRAVFRYPAPTVAAINGHAIAGGYILASACDHRLVAAGGARLGLTELAVGVPFPIAGLEIVRHAVGTPGASVLALSAALFDVETAVAAGFVHEVVEADALLDTAAALAAERAGRGAAYLHTKRQLQRPAWDAIEGGDDAEVLLAWTHPASHDRIRAFLDTLR
jgi:enoyl-CoA hydratase